MSPVFFKKKKNFTYPKTHKLDETRCEKFKPN